MYSEEVLSPSLVVMVLFDKIPEIQQCLFYKREHHNPFQWTCSQGWEKDQKKNRWKMVKKKNFSLHFAPLPKISVSVTNLLKKKKNQ